MGGAERSGLPDFEFSLAFSIESKSDSFTKCFASVLAAQRIRTDFELRLAFSMESKSGVFPIVFQRLGRRRKSGLANF